VAAEAAAEATADAVADGAVAPAHAADCPPAPECPVCAAAGAPAAPAGRVRLELAGGPLEPPPPPFKPAGADAVECAAFLAAGNTGARGGAPGTFTTFTSQFGQDAYIYRNFFAGRPAGGGFYVDVGANAPKELSNTWFFDKCLGWKGICVEASPTRAAQLKAQRGCKVVHNCVWSHEKTLLLSGTDAGSINDHLVAGGTYPVLCRTIDDILTAEKVPHIDYFSLDIESAEPQALRGMDFSRFAPDVVVVETFWLNQTVCVRKRRSPAARARHSLTPTPSLARTLRAPQAQHLLRPRLRHHGVCRARHGVRAARDARRRQPRALGVGPQQHRRLPLADAGAARRGARRVL